MSDTYVQKIQTESEAAKEAKRLRRFGVEIVYRRPSTADPKRVLVTYRVPANVGFGCSVTQ